MKCTKMKKARAKRAEVLFFMLKYANLRRFCSLFQGIDARNIVMADSKKN